ncbi:TonB-dependent receptor domain-containing protein [Alloalcanivorax mobilis]|uniref:TonB-dependent receptor domain-containing protein n=1 Tax=Alloalcanivorax mobilis TaxID=2019569 RepID=UPI000C75DC6A|nr:TonB-dependent receptor [Alloalcanivorax mobilis]
MRGSTSFRFGVWAAALGAASAASGEQVSNQLDAVNVISAAGFEQHIADAPASISVIGREELERKAYLDVTDALKDIPGVTITGGGSHQDISLRGMAAKYTMILVDGRRQSSRESTANGNDSGLEQNYLPPLQAIERIEVIRGPMSSLYGSEAMGGVINIITRKVSEQWTGALSSEMTVQDSGKAGDTTRNDLYLAGPLIKDRLGIQVNGLASHRDEDHIIDGFEEQTVQRAGAKLVYTPNKENDIAFGFDRIEQERNSSAGKTLESTDPADSSDREYDKDIYVVSHSGRYDFGTTESYVQKENSENPDRIGELRNGITLDTLIANTQASFFTERHIITTGVQYKDEDLTDYATNRLPTSDANNISRWEVAAFLEDQWTLTDKLALTGGLRFIRDENFGNYATPRLYAVYHATQDVTLKGGVSTGYRQPSLREATDNWGSVTGGGGYPAGNPRAIIRGNPDLDPEKSLNYELGLAWKNISGIETSVMLFLTEFKDKITEYRACDSVGADRNDPATWTCDYQGQTYMFISDRINVDEAQMHGVEATFSWILTPSLRFNSSYTYTHSEQKTGEFKGEPLNKIPKNMFNAGLDWQITDPLGSWVRTNFRGRTSDYLSRTSIADGTPSYAFTDVGLTYRASRNLTLKAGVYNLFDKEVTDADFGAVLDGRRYNAGMTVSF